MVKAKKKNVVVIGGGSGTSVALAGLKEYPLELSAIITTADNGSSSGKLRDEFNIIPPGDIRQCLVALASRDFAYLNERFQRGSLAGHTLGNLLITLFSERHKDFQQAIDELLAATGARGSLIPMTLQPVTLLAELKRGRTLQGESEITSSGEIRENLKSLYIAPRNAKANPRAISAITSADAIVVGPGNLFSSIMPNFLVRDIKRAFIVSRAKKIYVANLFTQPGHTDNFSLSDFVETLAKHIGKDVFDVVLYNNKRISSRAADKYRNSIIGSQVFISKDDKKDKRYMGRSIAKISPRVIAGDPIAKIRNPFLHDSGKLARAIVSLI